MKTTRTNGRVGFTLVEIMIVIAILALLLAMVIPSFIKARANGQANACINNLRQIDTAVQQFAVEAKKHVGDTIVYPDDVSAYVRMNSSGEIPSCPASGSYSLTTVGTVPSVLCSLGNTVTPAHLLP